MIAAVEALVRWIKAQAKGPFRSSIAHSVVTVLGLMPYQDPGRPWRLGWRSLLGPVGVVLFALTGTPLLWLATASITCGWYWRREYRANGISIRPRYRTGADGVREFSWPERLDSVMDVVFPTVALALLWWVL